MSDLVVFAKNRTEMMGAQAQLVQWADGKLAEARALLEEAATNLAHAKEQDWKLSGWYRQRLTAQKKVEFYEKIHAALAAGYVIVPDFPIDIFAIRTERTYPVKHYSTTNHTWSDNVDRTQHSELLPIGTGDYHDSQPLEKRGPEKKTDTGETVYGQWADAFKDVDFPIKAVRPVILEETSKALALKIFDEIGCLPGRPGWRPNRVPGRKGVDPMVIGRITYRYNQYHQKTVSFLIAWWLKSSDITV